jgi:hypothetical protein
MRILPFRLHGYSVDNNLAGRDEIERLVETVIGFQPGDVIAYLSAHAREEAACVWPAISSKTPPTRIFPSACNTIDRTVPLSAG